MKKKKTRLIWAGLAVVFLVALGGCASSEQEYEIFLSSRFGECVRRLEVSRGVLLIEIPRSASFRLQKGTSSWQKFIKPWGGEVFLVITYGQKTYVLSGEKTYLPVPWGGEVVLRLAYKEPFHPGIFRIWTGRMKGAEFRPSPIWFQIRTLKGSDCLPAGASPARLAQKPAPAKNPLVGWPGVLKRGLGLAPERPAYRRLLEEPIIFKKNPANYKGGERRERWLVY